MFFYNSLVLIITFHLLLQINSSEDFSVFVRRVPLTLRIHDLLSSSVLFDLFTYISFFLRLKVAVEELIYKFIRYFCLRDYSSLGSWGRMSDFLVFLADGFSGPVKHPRCLSSLCFVIFSLWLCCCSPSDFFDPVANNFLSIRELFLLPVCLSLPSHLYFSISLLSNVPFLYMLLFCRSFCP